MLREYSKSKEEIKISKTSVKYTISIWLIYVEKRTKEMT